MRKRGIHEQLLKFVKVLFYLQQVEKLFFSSDSPNPYVIVLNKFQNYTYFRKNLDCPNLNSIGDAFNTGGSNYRCHGGSGSATCGPSFGGFSESQITDDSVFHSDLRDSGFGNCGAVWSVSHCLVITPKVPLPTFTLVQFLTSKCTLSFTTPDRIITQEFSNTMGFDTVTATENLTVSFYFDCPASAVEYSIHMGGIV